jgi:hypothetical protein
VEDRISELEDKIEIKGKPEEILVKKLKSSERNMQELRDSIKRPNLRVMGIEEEGEQVQAKEKHKLANKIITEISQISRKIYPFRYRKLLGYQIVLVKIEPLHGILSQHAQRTEKENLLKAVREKK